MQIYLKGLLKIIETFSIVENWRFLTEVEQGISCQYLDYW